MVTSSDVAREAAVSQTTVSRVLNADPRVSAETRRRVEEVIERLGYTPNAVARGLATSRTNLVGVVVSDIMNPFYPELLEALESRLLAHGRRLVFTNAGGRSEDDYIRLLMEHRVDGILFTSALLDSAGVRSLIEERFPVVLANRYVEGVECDTVTGDNVGGARTAAEFLLELGHRRIGVIRGQERSSTSRDRYEGFVNALAAGGADAEPELCRDGEYRYDVAYREARALLELDRRPTALFCLNDVMAFAALNAARAAGLAVPRELSVVGFDDIRLSSWEAFQLTTVRQPLAEIARAAVELLVQRIEASQAPIQKLSFPSLLVRRATAGPAPASARRPRPAASRVDGRVG